MTKSSALRRAIVLCGALAAAGCQSPAAPTDPMSEPATLAGTWRGAFTGNLISSDAVTATLTQTDATVAGDWSSPMPAILVGLGAPADLNLSGPVTGTATGTAADLSFGFADIAVFRQYFAPGCALAVTVTSFSATTMEGTWTTNTSCQPPGTDNGTLTLTRQ